MRIISLVASFLVIRYQAVACAATSTVCAFFHVAFGIVPFSSSRSSKLSHLSQATTRTTRGGGSDAAEEGESKSTITTTISSENPLEGETTQSSNRQLSLLTWSDINSSLQDLDKNITSLFRQSRKDILESVRKRMHYINNEYGKSSLDALYQKLQQDSDTPGTKYSHNASVAGHAPSYLDRISKSFALFVVLCTNIQIAVKLLPALIASNSNLAEEIAAKVLSPETNGALKRIRSIISGLEPEYGVVDVFSRYPPKDVVASVLALSRLQHASEYYTDLQREKAENSTQKVVVTPENNPQLLSELAHYAVFANVAYGWKGGMAISGRFRLGNMQTLIQRTGMKEEDMVWAEWRSATHRPAFFIVRDKNRKNIVLSIRGTLSPKDILTDLCATPDYFYAEELDNDGKAEMRKKSLLRRLFGAPKRETLISNVRDRKPSMRAHHGMIQGAREIAQIAQGIVAKELESNPDFSLVLVGHSLGGGTAAVLGAMWKTLFPNLIVYAYGCPCVFPLETEASLHSSIISIVGKHDPFSTLSLGHLADISKALSFFCEDEEKRAQVISKCANKPQDINEEDLLWANEQMNAVRKYMTSEKLYPPGRILLISSPNQNKNGEKVQIEEVSKEKFQEIMLHPRIFDLSRHVPNRYEDELRELWLEYSETHKI